MRKLKQRLFSLLLCAALAVSLCVPAAAEETETYLTWNGSELVSAEVPASITEVTTGTTELNGTTTGGWYIVRGSVEISSRVNVSGNVHLILANECNLKAAKGINVGEGNSLTIYAQSADKNTMGTLTATSDIFSAGIGGNFNSAGGTITINGGMVTAAGGDHAAGIGGGNGRVGGTITINGGVVTATGIGGAGIGGGGYGAGGKINITGGEVTATGGGGAGIGGGFGGAGGEITITSGTVTATGDIGAGIGGGGGENVGGAGGKITITGGTVTATSSSEIGAGIGRGGGYSGANSDSGTFTTGPNGSAFIMANGISDQSGKDNGSWSGVIFGGSRYGKVYGSEITLAADAEIPANRTLEIEAGQILAIGEDVTLTNNGKITGNGTIIGTVNNNGTIEAGITVQDHSHQWDTAWSSDATNHWHKCTVTDCNEQRDTAGHTPGDWIVDQAATSTEAGSRHKACSVCGYVTATETIPATGGGNGDGDGGSGGDDGDGGGGGETYTPPTYKPEVSKPGQGGGTPAISPANPKQGDTVTVTPEPDEGYEVDKITVTGKNGKPVEVTQKPDGTYTFRQPSGQVTIEIEYAPVPLTDLPWNNPFTDVSEGDWYYEAVWFVHERGLMNGYSDGRFGPNDILSRAQLAQILFNKEGRPGVDYLLNFSDVAGEAWYADAVTWAAANGIVGGYGDGRFGPNDPITREQLAVMLWRYSGSPAATKKELYFNDTDEISPFALEALRWAVENGILNGYGDGRLGPQGQATRAQVAQMLKNFIENQEEDT